MDTRTALFTDCDAGKYLAGGKWFVFVYTPPSGAIGILLFGDLGLSIPGKEDNNQRILYTVLFYGNESVGICRPDSVFERPAIGVVGKIPTGNNYPAFHKILIPRPVPFDY